MLKKAQPMQVKKNVPFTTKASGAVGLAGSDGAVTSVHETRSLEHQYPPCVSVVKSQYVPFHGTRVKSAAARHLPCQRRSAWRRPGHEQRQTEAEPVAAGQRLTHVHAVGEVDGVTERLVAAGGHGGSCEHEQQPQRRHPARIFCCHGHKKFPLCTR